MPDFSRDTNIGYPEADTHKITVTNVIETEEGKNIIQALEAATEELKRTRRANELILGQEVEVLDEEDD